VAKRGPKSGQREGNRSIPSKILMSKSLPEKETPAATVFTLSYSLSTMIIRMMWSVKDVCQVDWDFSGVGCHPALRDASGTQRPLIRRVREWMGHPMLPGARRARGWATRLTSRWCSERRLRSARQRSKRENPTVAREFS